VFIVAIRSISFELWIAVHNLQRVHLWIKALRLNLAIIFWLDLSAYLYKELWQDKLFG